MSIYLLKKGPWKGDTRTLQCAGHTGQEWRYLGGAGYFVVFNDETSPVFRRSYEAANWFIEKVKAVPA